MSELSIVIPTFDTAAMTLRCCQAVLASMPSSSEVIVSDDGSRDGTAELLAREVPEVRVVRHETNRGFAAAANDGVAAAQGRIILLLNSDAIVERGALHALMAAFEGDAGLGVVGARLLNSDGSEQWSGGRTPALVWMLGVVSGLGGALRVLRKRRQSRRTPIDWVSGAAMAFRREVWEAAGPLDERFRFYCQDIEFCLRASRAGWRVAIDETFRVTHAIGGTVAAGDPLQHDPARLWPDLLAWGSRHYGRAWTAFARPVLVSVAAMRIAARTIVRRDTKPMRVALRRLAQSDS